MLERIRRSWVWHRRWLRPKPEGDEGLKIRDHRAMVGSKWEVLGELQFNFMLERGLKPDDIFLDIACGAFRGGRHFIPYMKPGHYLGIDKQLALVREGRAKEIPADIWERQKPEIVISGQFEFERFSKRPTKALAQSLFTHLRARDIKLCLRKLYAHAAPGCEFYATFNETDEPLFYLLSSHSSRRFDYTRRAMLSFGERYGWHAEYVGDWGHPQQQKMLRFVKPAF